MKPVVLAGAVMITFATPSMADAKGEAGGVFAFCYGADALFAYSVRFPESAPNTVVVATNFGLLVSHDAGITFGWVCPITYGGFVDPDHRMPAPPGIATLPDASMFALGGGVGYFHSEDGCNWLRTLDIDFDARSLTSLAFRPDVPTVLAAASFPGRPPFGIYASSDGGRDFMTTSFFTDASTLFAGLHMTQTGAHAFALTSVSSEVHLWRSDNLGGEWNELPGAIGARAAALIASGGTDNELLYATTVEATAEPCEVNLAVLRSSNAGEGFAPLTRRDDFLVGAVPEGQDLWLGWKDSGIERVQPDGMTVPLEGLAPLVLACLTADPDNALVACPVAPGPELAMVHDPAGARFVPLSTRLNIRGPLECPAGSTVETQCASLWDAVAERWHLGDHYVPPEPASEGSDPDRTRDDSDRAIDAVGPPLAPGGGCCATTGVRNSAGASLWLASILVVLGFKARKRQEGHRCLRRTAPRD